MTPRLPSLGDLADATIPSLLNPPVHERAFIYCRSTHHVLLACSTFSTLVVAMTRRDAKLLPLFLQGDKTAHLPHDPPQYDQPRRRLWHGVAFVTLALLISASYFHYGRWHWCSGSPPETMTTGLGLPKEVQQAWAAHSPYFPAGDYIAPPERCEIVQVCYSRSDSFSSYLKRAYGNLG